MYCIVLCSLMSTLINVLCIVLFEVAVMSFLFILFTCPGTMDANYLLAVSSAITFNCVWSL